MAVPSISNLTQLNASDANTWNSATVGNADGSIADLAVSQGGINPPNTCSTFENSSSGTTINLKYSAYSASWTAVDISGANQAILFHFAGDPGQFNRVSTAADGITAYAFDSGANRATDYLYEELGGSGDTFYAGAANFFPVLLFSANMTSAGAIDDTDIAEVGIAWKAADTGQYGVDFRIDQILHIDGEVSFDDGDGTTPGTWSGYYDLVKQSASGTIYNKANEQIKPFYGFGFPVLMNCVNFADSNFTVAFLPQNSDAAFNPPASGYYSLTINPTTATATHSYTDGVFAYDSGTYPLVIDGTSLTTGTITLTRCAGLNAGAVTVAGAQVTLTSCTIPSPTSVDLQDALITGLTVDSCAGPVVISGQLASGSSVTITSPDADALQFDINPVDDSGRTYTVPASATVNFNPTTTGTYILTGLTNASGSMELDNLSANNITVNAASALTYTVASPTTGGGTITVVKPVATFTINTNISAYIRIFTSGTQTVLDSATAATTLAYQHGNETVDYEVGAGGYYWQRFTGTTLSGTASVTVNLVAEPFYNASHSLTYTTDASHTRATNRLNIPTFGPSGQDVWSLMSEAWGTETALYNTEFSYQLNGPGSLFLRNDCEGATDSDIENLTGSGVRYVTSAGATAASWVHVQSIGTAAGFTGEYQQQDGSGTTDARTTGPFNQLIKVYGDGSHGNFDYRGHLVLKFQPNGYRELRADVLGIYGISTLSPSSYILAMEPAAINAATGDPAISITVTDHGASPVSWNGLNFGITITDSTGGNSAEAILREINYNLSLDATYQGKDPFNWPEMVKELGDGYDTLYGYTEGAQSSTLKGVRVVQNDGTTAHAGFTRFQSDSGAYYTPPTVAQISAPNLTAGRIQVVNETGRTSGAWAATTAYSLYNKVLRSTGPGSESGAGLFFQCTTAGTTGGTEPTWDTTPGNTTADGTTTWTCRAIEFDNTTTTSGYSNSWTDHEEFDNGDTIRMRWVDEDDMEIARVGIATSDGITSFLDTPEADTVYNSNGIDGSTLTSKFAADYTDDEIDIILNSNFTGAEIYAFYKYALTTAQGIREFFGGCIALNEGNYRFENVINLLLDNTTTDEVWQTDNSRIYREDGVRPVKNPTSGGGGIDLNWQIEVLVVTAGSILTAGQAAELTQAAQAATVNSKIGTPATDVAADIAAVKADTAATLTDTSELQGDWADGGRLDAILDTRASQASVDTIDTNVDGVKTATDQLTFTQAGAVDANIKRVNDVEITGTGIEEDEWRPAP